MRMSDWKELRIDDLSDCPDIFNGKYELEFRDEEYTEWRASVSYKNGGYPTIIAKLQNGSEYRYRKPELELNREQIRKNHIGSVSMCMHFNEEGYRDTVCNALLFLLKTDSIPPEE
jgi:hypothetical protein